jgi:nicotinamide-nucleotide amidase
LAQALDNLVSRLSTALLARGESLATAESCTGGWVAKACTDQAGSSAWFERGFVTYSNESKEDLLAVSLDTLSRYGAVSKQTVLEMAEGVLRNSLAEWGLAISGIAGPGGGSEEKPVGTVWIAWAGPDGWMLSRSYHFDGDRDAVRRQAAETALAVLIDRVSDLK